MFCWDIGRYRMLIQRKQCQYQILIDEFARSHGRQPTGEFKSVAVSRSKRSSIRMKCNQLQHLEFYELANYCANCMLIFMSSGGQAHFSYHTRDSTLFRIQFVHCVYSIDPLLSIELINTSAHIFYHQRFATINAG